MRLNVIEFRHGKTTPDRSTRRQAGATDRRDLPLSRILATMSGGATTGTFRGHPRTDRRHLGRGPCDCGATPNCLSQARVGRIQPRAQLGWTPPVPAHPGGRGRVLTTLAGKCRHRQPGGRFPDSSGLGATVGQTGQGVGGLPFVGAPWLAKGGPRHAPSQEQTRGSGGVEKNSRKCWKPCSLPTSSRDATFG